MKIRFLLPLFCILSLFSCNQEEIINNDANLESRSVNSAYSYFLNVESYTSDTTGEATIVGEIHCTQAGTYSILFAFNGDTGSSYWANIGSNLIYPSNGSTFRTMNITLQPGIHKCSVSTLFTDVNQHAEARLYIQGINGSSAGDYEGFGDLTVQSSSKLWHGWPQSVPVHWTCSKCRATNGAPDFCVFCGNKKGENDAPEPF